MSAARRYGVSLVWLRRDLRLRDSVALYAACRSSDRVALAFVLDRALLSQARIGAPIVHVFLCALTRLREELRLLGSDLVVLHGDFQGEIAALASRIGAGAVFFNDDYEPAAVRRDDAVAAGLAEMGIEVHRSTDHVYFGADEIVRSNGNPYRIFTPYKRCWLERRAITPRAVVPSYAAVKGRLLEKASLRSWGVAIPTPGALGFSSIPFDVNVSERAAHRRLTHFLEHRVSRYRIDRNVPALDGTSQLSADLRAGTLGIRTCVERAFECRGRLTGEARAGVDVWISELIWRDFYQMIYKRFPFVESRAFQPLADGIAWNEPGTAFVAWCAGRTGYPIVDAAMRQLNETGWMHNRVRMIVAAFLSKDLLIDWRLGAQYFEQRLIDADPAQNNGGWQWAASTGTDAAPYFRIFNPVLQSRRFDPGGEFIRRFLPELSTVPRRYVHEPWKMPAAVQQFVGVVIGHDYPPPLIDHDAARRRALHAYGEALGRPPFVLDKGVDGGA